MPDREAWSWCLGSKGLVMVPGVGVGGKDGGCPVTWHLDHLRWLPVSTGSSFEFTFYKFIFLPPKPDRLISLFKSLRGGSILLFLQVIITFTDPQKTAPTSSNRIFCCSPSTKRTRLSDHNRQSRSVSIPTNK